MHSGFTHGTASSIHEEQRCLCERCPVVQRQDAAHRGGGLDDGRRWQLASTRTPPPLAQRTQNLRHTAATHLSLGAARFTHDEEAVW